MSLNEAHRLQVFISQQEIQAAISRLADEIRRDYQGKDPLLLGVLKGSFVFMADLIRCLDLPLEVDFVRLSSYGAGTVSCGKIKMAYGTRLPVKARDVLVVEDIVDTGLTTAFLLECLKRKKPASLRLCALLDKTGRRQVSVPIDYLGFTVPNKFLVGYGLDCNEQYRYLPDIRILEC